MANRPVPTRTTAPFEPFRRRGRLASEVESAALRGGLTSDQSEAASEGGGRGHSIRTLSVFRTALLYGVTQTGGRWPSIRTLSVLLATLASLAFVGCGSDSPSEPPPTATAEVGVVVNSESSSLSVFEVENPQAVTTIGLGADGSPVTLAARGATAVVPLGTVPAVAIVDLAAGEVVHTVALPEGSGATGAAFLNDSIALVANPARNSVSPIQVRTGERGEELAVGGFPEAILAVEDTAFVLNRELGDDFQPTGPGTISVVVAEPLRVVRTITLSGTNPGAAAFGSDGGMYVVGSGRFGQGEGSVSVVDRAALDEVEHIAGFGDFPGSIVIDVDGRAYIGSFAYGLAIWDTQTHEFIREPSNAIEPGGIPATSGVAIDSEGRLYSLEPACTEPGTAYRLTASFQVAEAISVGTCPVSIVFTTIPAPGT